MVFQFDDLKFLHIFEELKKIVTNFICDLKVLKFYQLQQQNNDGEKITFGKIKAFQTGATGMHTMC